MINIYQYTKNIFHKWFGRISFSLLDQALFSGTNFIFNILLVRWLSVQEYGIYSIIFTVFLVISGVHNSLILEPMQIFGPTSHKEDQYQYTIINVKLHFLISILISSLLFISLFFAYYFFQDFFTTLLSLAIFLPFILLFWLYRSVCYMTINPKVSFSGTVMYFIGTLSLLVLFESIKNVTGFICFLIPGIASFISIVIFQKYIYGKNINVFLNTSRSDLISIAKENWEYGKWILGASAAYSLGTLIYSPLIGVFVGIPQAGAYRAMLNLTQPLIQIVTALSQLSLPTISRYVSNKVQSQIHLNLFIITFFLLGLIYFLGIITLGESIIDIIYNQPFYKSYYWLIYFLALSGFFLTTGQPISIILRAKNKPQPVLYSRLFSCVYILIFGIFLINHYGLIGVMVSVVISSLLELIVLVYYLLKK